MGSRCKGVGHVSVRIAGFAALVLVLVQLICACDYARMKDDESLRTYKQALPDAPKNVIPTTGGDEVLRETPPDQLHNPLPFSQATVERGKIAYGYFCVHCHGPQGDGYGTVGQSFEPLPTNLKDKYVQQQSDGEIFHRMSFGFKRTPPLASTISIDDRWAVVNYLRFLAGKRIGS
jgi:hypothetical protein